MEEASQATGGAAGGGRPLKGGSKSPVAFVFTGQGSQWQGVGMDLMVFPVYNRAVHRVDQLFMSLSGWSILDKMKEGLSAAKVVHNTCYAQAITFMVQVGLVELLKYFHVVPGVVVGHSAGEVAAAYAAGLLTLEQAVKVGFQEDMPLVISYLGLDNHGSGVREGPF